MTSLADKVANYFVALITGVILLFVLWQVIISLASELPSFLQFGIAIVLAAAGALLVIAKRGIIPREQVSDSDIDLDIENDIQHSYVRVNGIVTETSENDAEGSWRYEFNEYHGIHELDIQLIESIDEKPITRHLRADGLPHIRTGFWGDVNRFIHVTEMNESTEEDEYHVYVFAWGDTETFEAAILPYTTENEQVYNNFNDLHTSELLDFIKALIESSDDIIYGETTRIHFERT